MNMNKAMLTLPSLPLLLLLALLQGGASASPLPIPIPSWRTTTNYFVPLRLPTVFQIPFEIPFLSSKISFALPWAARPKEPAPVSVQVSNANAPSGGDGWKPKPVFMAYGDYGQSDNQPPPVQDLVGFNVFALAFWWTPNAEDYAAEWTKLTDTQRSSIKAQYNAQGMNLVVSAFGAAHSPTSSGLDPNQTAQELASWVQKYNLDGVDIDYEDFKAMGQGTAESWLVTFSKALRAALPKDDYIISHAPVASWFVPNSSNLPGGGYLTVEKQAGDSIDWYNVQFYNGGPGVWENCTDLIHNDQSYGVSVHQINQAGIPLDKIVIGKPLNSGDEDPPAPGDGGGYMSPGTLASCVGEAHADLGWNGGVMFWEIHENQNASSIIETVRGSTWPLN